MSYSQEFLDHLTTGATSLCNCWFLVRKDGVSFGFTDHDLPLNFDGMSFKAHSGMSAKALQQTAGLSIDNSEAVGALSDSAITESDIAAGRYDNATIKTWLVNWSDVSQRQLLFSGSLGELRRKGHEFHAELRGLSDALNQPQGRIYHKDCSAVLGDSHCGVDLTQYGYSVEIPLETIKKAQSFHFANLSGFDIRWFEGGRFTILTGEGAGLVGVIKNDRIIGVGRRIELWESIRANLEPGDMVRLQVGCDKRKETCQLKFDNLLNFRGFPDIPGEDWLTSFPANSDVNDGGSLNRG